MSKDNNSLNQVSEPVLKDINPEAINHLSWLSADTQNFKDSAWRLFSINVDLTDKYIIETLSAAKIYLAEIEDDIVKLKAFLEDYSLTNNN